MNKKPKLIIIGAGFAGLKLARDLSNSEFEILLIDKFNHHQFQPLFYQVATAGLEPSAISFPLRSIFHHSKNVRIRLAEVKKIFPSQNKIETSIGDFDFDYLVIATGADTNFFGNKNLESLTIPMKSTSEALQLRYRILQNFENAVSASPENLEALMTFVIVGGGPTGVELAGALAEMKKHVLPKDFSDFDFSMMKILLIEGSGQTLNSMSDHASAVSQKYLEQLGVQVMLNTRVKDYDGENIVLESGERIKTKMVIWAAGITGNVIDGLNAELIVRGNRIKVDRYNRVDGHSNIFALGDIASMTTEKYPNGHPQVANVALEQAGLLCKNLKNILSNKPLIQFEYKDKGSLATVGKHKAVVDLPFIKFKGWLAWYVWMGLHLLLLMGMKNRLIVFIDWVIAYFTNNSALRLIFKPFAKRN